MASNTVRTFTDPDAYHAAIRNTKAEGIVTARGEFSAELTNIWLDRVFVQSGNESLPRVAYSTIDPTWLAIAFATSLDQQISVNGLELPQGEIVVFRAGAEGHNRSSTACQWGSIALTHADVAAAGQALSGRELGAPAVTHRIKPTPLLLSRLLNLHEAAGHLVKTAPDILGKPEVGRAMDQALVEAMIACLATGDPFAERSAYRHHARVMRRLEELLYADSEGSLYMDDLCKATGVSYRTLHACCQEHLGMSPKRYLLLRRMHLAHRALRMGETSVTEIATDYGFWELGRFSVTYRSLFGESPSTTLRRPPDDSKALEVAGLRRQFAKFA